MTETELEWFAQGKEKNWLLGRGLNVDSPFFGCLRGATSGDVRTMIYNLKAQDAIELAPRLYPKLRVKGD